MPPRLFKSKANRDAAYQLELARGRRLRRGTTRGQLLHPQYVEDSTPEDGRYDTGFGNSVYQTYWGVLYTLGG